MAQKPRLVIIGGPNGSGKTTQARVMMVEWSLTYLGADQVAEELGLGSTGADAVHAGRAFMARIDKALAERRSVLLESTLSGLGTRRLIQRFRAAGYDTTIVLVFVDSPDVCISRIRARVARGGHFVPDADVRRRFYRSLRNFWHVYRQQADRWRLHYNGVEACVTVGQGRGSTMVTLDSARLQLFERLLEVR